MIQQLLAIAAKELQILAKDRGTLAVLFLLPILLGSILGSANQAAVNAANGDTNDDDTSQSTLVLDLLLVNEDGGTYGDQIITILTDIDILNVTLADDVTTADAQVGAGNVVAAIHIPANFSQQIEAYDPVQLQLIVDPAQGEAVNIITEILNQISVGFNLQADLTYGIKTALSTADPQTVMAVVPEIEGIVSQLDAKLDQPQVTVTTTTLGGETPDDFNVFAYVMPGFTVMFAFFLVGTIGATLLKEKEDGSFRRLLAAPMPHAAIIGGKMIAYVLVVVAQVVVLFAVGRLLFNMPLGNSPLALALLTLSLGAVAASLGMLIAALARSHRQADAVGTILAFILAGLGGCIVYFPPNSFMGKVSQFTPHGQALRGFANLMADGATLGQTVPHVTAVLGFAALFFGLAMWRFKFE